VSIGDTIARALANAAKLKSNGSGNEANTKALVIEPMLDALGWNPGDFDDVEREVKTAEGTFLDYALKLDGEARVYVEAKGLGENLDDNKFVSQTVNYANNDGIVWCVLTNGLRFRVYKTNEIAVMNRKLLFQVDLADDSESLGEKAKMLRLISRAAVAAGELDRFGDRVFTDGRVRKALAAMAANPPAAIMEAVAAHLGHPPVGPDALRRSLARIFDAPVDAGATATSAGRLNAGGPAKEPLLGPPTPPKGQEYDLAHHLANKSALINDLFSEVNAIATALGADVSRRVRKQYIGYFRGKKSFFTAEVQHQRIWIYLALDPATTKPWNDAVMRDATNIGHFGMGDVEYSLRNVEQMDELKALIQSAYDARA
jgi:predicted transport protein